MLLCLSFQCIHMALSKPDVWSQLVHCSSPEVVKVSRSLRSKLSNASKTAILECVVCAILVPNEGPSSPCCMTLKQVMQLPPTAVACFRKFCEIAYKRCVSQDIDEFLGQALPELIEMMHTEHSVHHLVDCRTKCTVYPPAPKANLYSSPAAVLEYFFAAIHLLFQPKSCVLPFADSVLKHGINEDILLFYCSLARRKISPLACQTLPSLLEYMWQKVTPDDVTQTPDDVTQTAPRLLIAIKCFNEAKYPRFLNAIRHRSKNFDVRRSQKAVCPLDYFLSSGWGRRIVKICMTENLGHQLDDKENLVAQFKKNLPLPSQQGQGLAVLQPSSDRTSSSTREDFYIPGGVNVPEIFVDNPVHGVS